jgi:cytochrome c553
MGAAKRLLMKRTQLLTSIAMSTLFGVGCVPSIPEHQVAGADAPGGTATPREMFDSTVAPLLAACSGCHVGTETSSTDMFLGPPPATADSMYAGITGDRRVNGDFSPASAELLTKGTHEGVTWWTAAQAQTISAWLEAEAAARGSGDGSDIVPITGSGSGSDGGGTGGVTDPIAAEQQWASCLAASGSAYESTKVYEIANMISSQGTCYSCHEPGGAGGAYWGIDNNYQTMLTKWQEQVFITAPFEVGEAATGNTVTYKMISGREKICAKGMEQDNNGGTHPSFDCEQTVGGVKPVDALDAFTTAVQANEDAGLCPAPGMFQPPG